MAKEEKKSEKKAEFKVVEESEASNRQETVAGIKEGKKAKYQ